MIDIVAHFFVLYPLFTLVKEHGKSPVVVLGVNLSVLAVTALMTMHYLMDVNLVAETENINDMTMYQVMDTTPRDFMSMNSSSVKRMYRDLSRKYHPDKNAEDTTAKFQKLKEAYDILSDKDKRVAYDLYGKTDFSQDDRMLDTIAMKF